MRDDHLDLFITRLDEIGVELDVVKGRREAVSRISELVGDTQTCYWKHPIFKKMKFEGVAAENAELSLVVADFAIAESGTVGLVHGPGKAAADGLLPPRQIVVVEEKNIKNTLRDALMEIYSGNGPREVPANIVLVTGPSKTADIGLTTIIGVHSPKELHVVIM